MILTVAVALVAMPPWGGFLIAIPNKFQAWTQWIGHVLGWGIVPSLVGVDVGTLLMKDVLGFFVGLTDSPLVGLTCAVLLWRLRQPRPSLRALMHQPGFVACLAAPLFLLIALEANYFGAQFSLDFMIAGGIMTAWILLALRGRWEAEPGWIDRLGRLAGVGWITVALCKILERLI